MSKVLVKHSLTVQGVPSAVVEVCKTLLSELETYSFSAEDIFAIHLAFEEAFANAIKHGNKMDPSKVVKIDYAVTPDKVEISITDQGPGFNPQDIPDPRCDGNIYKTGGRGLFLIRSYMDVVDFNSQGNCLHMVKFKGKTNQDVT